MPTNVVFISHHFEASENKAIFVAAKCPVLVIHFVEIMFYTPNIEVFVINESHSSVLRREHDSTRSRAAAAAA